MAEEKDRIERALRRGGFCEEGAAVLTPLTGGVSSAIYRVDIGHQSFCAKCALEKLKVDSEWHASPTRSFSEAAWLGWVASEFPGRAPTVFAMDRQDIVIIMSFLEPQDFPVWKDELLKGVISTDFAGEIGICLGQIHARSVSQKDLRAQFPPNELFFDLRIEPYLLATAEALPEVAAELKELAESLNGDVSCLIHGDISPKNILCSSTGPVFLDAECACFGDPAFDIAFCLNHLTLKGVNDTARHREFGDAFVSMWDAYKHCVNWELVKDLEGRVLQLLPAFQLARLYGRSPVEYIKHTEVKNHIREFAVAALKNPFANLHEFSEKWSEHVAKL